MANPKSYYVATVLRWARKSDMRYGPKGKGYVCEIKEITGDGQNNIRSITATGYTMVEALTLAANEIDPDGSLGISADPLERVYPQDWTYLPIEGTPS